MGGSSSSRALLGQIRLFITSSLGVQNQNKCNPTNRRSLSRESSLADIVEGIPPTFAQRPQTKSAEVGTSAELECRFVHDMELFKGSFPGLFQAHLDAVLP